MTRATTRTGLLLTIVVIVANDNFLNLAILAHLTPEILVKGVKVCLQTLRIHLVLWVICWILIHVRQKYRLTV